MKKRLGFMFLILMQVCFVNVAFAQSEWTELNVNAKTSTYGNTKYYNQKLSMEEAIQVSMYFSVSFKGWDFDSKIYSKKEFTKTKDFDDKYIYGSAVNAVTKQGYGIVSIDYYLWDDEYVSDVGWDCMYLMKLKDDRVLCLRLTKPTDAYVADEYME